MNVKPSFAGVVTEIITPFGENGELDEALLREEVEQQVKSGVQGLFTNGLASECLSMTMEERKRPPGSYAARQREGSLSCPILRGTTMRSAKNF